MGGYADYAMRPARAASPVAGVCHRRGVKADLPSQWLIYIAVDDLDASLARCRERGGELIAGPRAEAEGARFAVIRDLAGAVAAHDRVVRRGGPGRRRGDLAVAERRQIAPRALGVRGDERGWLARE
jgi:hypothetical protein